MPGRPSHGDSRLGDARWASARNGRGRTRSGELPQPGPRVLPRSGRARAGP
uniref:Uncharacterized protein n=1 Tax=Arundo donax TaxID=35708 RepID=A0A0A8ZRY5_ARUDO